MEPFIGEIRIFAGNFAPENWALCNGASLSISAFSELYSLIGTTYGGDGVSNFNLPDLRGRVPVHFNGNLGQAGGVETVTLTPNQIPAHSHQLMADNATASDSSGAGKLVGQTSAFNPYVNAAPTVAMAGNAISTTNIGGSQPHENMQPFVCFNFIIATSGVWPPQN